jgi:hypothetical protein
MRPNSIYDAIIKTMKKIILSLIFLGILSAASYFFVSNKDEGQLRSTSQSNRTATEVTLKEFTWSATDIDPGPGNAGSDFISASNLQVSAFDKTYRVNGYLNKEVYGCRGVTNDYRDSVLAQYDSSYSSAFFMNAVSYYLCPSMGGGDLFVIVEADNGYKVKHYPYGDGQTPFTKLNPVTLFVIQE